MKVVRTLSRSIKRINHRFPVLLITGPRQVGKTTLLQMCGESQKAKQAFQFVSLDDLEVRLMAQKDPNAFFNRYKPPIIIDEIQYAPNLLTQIKIIVDQVRRNNLFWLTGSQKFTLMKSIQESLAGRIAILDLLSFSQAELDQRPLSVKPFLPTQKWINSSKKQKLSQTSILGIYKNIWLGSFPQLRANSLSLSPQLNVQLIQERNVFYESYLRTYLQRDIKDILNVTSTQSFLQFLRVLAARTGQLLNYSDMMRDVGVNHKTIKAWLSVLEATGLIFLLYPYYRNVTKRLIKTPKIYFLETGLCSYLTKWPDHKTLESGMMAGPILETYIFTEILKTYWHNGLNPYFYYYRDRDQNEIDLLIETGDFLYPVEFKKTSTPSLISKKPFKLLDQLGKKIQKATIICFVSEYKPLSRDMQALPVYYL